MGFSLQCIIINSKTSDTNEELLVKLGINSFDKIGEEPFEVAMNDFGNTYIGNYKNNILIIDSDLVVDAFDSMNLSAPEKKLVELFPDAEIFLSTLISSMNFFAFAIIKNGQKIRVKSGSADEGTRIDQGEPLDEEKELLSKSKLDGNNKRVYFLGENGERIYSEDQVGENFVFEIFKRYTGTKFNMDNDIMEVVLSGYTRL